MIKILILLAIITLSGALGLAISAEKKREMKVFEQFYEFNERLILNLKFGRESVDKIAEEFDSVKRAFKGQPPLKGEEGEFLLNYVSRIGSTDALTQVEYLNERKQRLQQYRETSRENYKKYGSLYFKLSLMAGILIAVLLA